MRDEYWFLSGESIIRKKKLHAGFPESFVEGAKSYPIHCWWQLAIIPLWVGSKGILNEAHHVISERETLNYLIYWVSSKPLSLALLFSVVSSTKTETDMFGLLAPIFFNTTNPFLSPFVSFFFFCSGNNLWKMSNFWHIVQIWKVA